MDLLRAPPAEGHALPVPPSSHEPGDLTDVGLRVGPIRTEPGRLTEQAGVRRLRGPASPAAEFAPPPPPPAHPVVAHYPAFGAEFEAMFLDADADADADLAAAYGHLKA